MINSCEHCGYVGRQYSIVDSEGKTCEVRIKEGEGKGKRSVYRAFQVCTSCLKINIKRVTGD